MHDMPPFPFEMFLFRSVLCFGAGISTLKSNGRISPLRRQLGLGSFIHSFPLLYKYPFGNLDDCLCFIYIVLYQSSTGAGKSRRFPFFVLFFCSCLLFDI